MTHLRNDRPIHDHRVPSIVLIPQVIGVMAYPGTALDRRMAFLAVVTVNVFVALAGRLTLDEPQVPAWFIEWARTAAAWGYAAVLALLLPLLAPSAHHAFIIAILTSATVGGLLYLAPGQSTPQGVRQQLLQAAGASTRGDIVDFYASRATRLSTVVALPLYAIDIRVGAAITLLAVAGHMLRASRASRQLNHPTSTAHARNNY